MNRDRYVPRIIRNPETDELVRLQPGGESAEVLALALAAISTPEYLERLLFHTAAINEFGGEFYVAGARKKISDGEIVAADEPGGYETVGHIFSFSKRAQIKSQSGPTLSPQQIDEAVRKLRKNGMEEEDAREYVAGIQARLHEPDTRHQVLGRKPDVEDVARGTQEPPVPVGANGSPED